MPHIRFRSIDKNSVKKLSAVLSQELAQVMSTAEDNFTFELVSTEFFFSGKETSSFPFVEVLWFSRSQEVQDLSAVVITKFVKELLGSQDVVVVFTELAKTAYYENGEHFG